MEMSEYMRVCMISVGVGAAGGLENAISEISRVLTKHDVQVTIFSSHSRDTAKVYKNCTIEELVHYNLLPYGRHS